MKRGLILLLILSIFLVACSQTTVVKKNGEVVKPSTSMINTTQPSTGGAFVSTEGKVITKCEDTDSNDPATIGRVRVTYSDGTTQDYYDECPGEDIFQTEYFCDGNVLKSKNNICKGQCLLIPVKDDSCKDCKVAACMDIK